MVTMHTEPNAPTFGLVLSLVKGNVEFSGRSYLYLDGENIGTK